MNIGEKFAVAISPVLGGLVGYALDPDISNILLGAFAGLGMLALSFAGIDYVNEKLEKHYTGR